MPRQFSLILFALTLVACGGSGGTTNVEDLTTREVTFPNGQKVRAEVMVKEQDMMRGMMFRDSIAPDRGMLFVHGAPGQYKYWMYQVRIPLDIIWMDRQHQIVEISANTPACKEQSAQQCPNFGGNYPAMFVLELGGGMAQKYNLRVGDKVEF